MELFNNISKQQSTQIQTEQRTAQAKPEPVQEVKAQIEKAQKEEQAQVNQNVPDVKDLIDNLNRALDPFNTSIRFGFDNAGDVFYVSVIDTHTNDMIRRFPVEQANTLAGKMNEIVGIIFDEKG